MSQDVYIWTCVTKSWSIATIYIRDRRLQTCDWLQLSVRRCSEYWFSDVVVDSSWYCVGARRWWGFWGHVSLPCSHLSQTSRYLHQGVWQVSLSKHSLNTLFKCWWHLFCILNCIFIMGIVIHTFEWDVDELVLMTVSWDAALMCIISQFTVAVWAWSDKGHCRTNFEIHGDEILDTCSWKLCYHYSFMHKQCTPWYTGESILWKG